MSETGIWGRTVKRMAVVAAALSGLAACGGGGGGGASTEPVVTPAAVNLRLVNLRFSGSTQTLFDDINAFVRDVSITADVQGDLAQLNGQTLFVIVEDSEQLFQSDVILALGGATDNRITLLGRSLEGRAGSYRGPLKVNVCLDAACTRPFQGSPFEVPYQIDVLPGIQVNAATPIRISSSFGRVPEALTVPVTLPAGMQFFSGFVVGPPSIMLNSPVTAATVNGPSSAVQLQGQLMPVGTYELTLIVSGTASAGGLTYALNRNVPVTYTVVESPGLSGLMTPASLALNAVASPGQDLATGDVQLLAADGQRYNQLSRIVYLPPGPNGNLDAGALAWLQFFAPFDGSISANTRLQMLAHACLFRSSPTDPTVCLATGRYDALVYLRTEAGTEYPTPLPVSLAVRAFAAFP